MHSIKYLNFLIVKFHCLIHSENVFSNYQVMKNLGFITHLQDLELNAMYDKVSGLVMLHFYLFHLLE